MRIRMAPDEPWVCPMLALDLVQEATVRTHAFAAMTRVVLRLRCVVIARHLGPRNGAHPRGRPPHAVACYQTPANRKQAGQSDRTRGDRDLLMALPAR